MRSEIVETKINKRINWIDYSKFIGIYLVVLGHLDIPESIKNPIYAFHMPLFFFISGYLFSFDKHPIYKKFLFQRAKQLLIPYIVFNIITYLIWVFVGRKFGANTDTNIPFYKPIIGMFYGNGNFLIHDNVLWFLTCLFVVENVYYLLFKKSSTPIKTFFMLVFLLAGQLYYKLGNIYLPWGIDTAMVAIVFYGIANFSKTFLETFLETKIQYLVLILVLISALLLVSSRLNGRVDMLGYSFGNYALFFINAFFGILAVISLSRILDLLVGRIKFIVYISMNTIVLLAFHNVAFSAIKAISVFVFKLPLSIYLSNISLNFFVAWLAILILVPVIEVFIRFFPALIGKR